MYNMETRITLEEIFAALRTVTNAIPNIAGIDFWRQEMEDPRLRLIDPELATELTAPPSKLQGQFTGTKATIWHRLHFNLMMPALQTTIERVLKNNVLRTMPITDTQAMYFFAQLKAVKQHIRHYKEYESLIGDLKSGDYTLPDDPEDLPHDLQALLQNEVEHTDNHLIGRILQTHYAQRAKESMDFNIGPHVIAYYTGGKRNLAQRMSRYVFEALPACPLFDRPDKQLYAPDLFHLYTWLSHHSVVEMISPDFKGAAYEASTRVLELINSIYNSKDIDLRTPDIERKSLEALYEDKDLLRRWGRMAWILREIGDGLPDYRPINDQDMLRLAYKIWPNPKERQAVWGDPDCYIPHTEQDKNAQIHAQLLRARDEAIVSLPDALPGAVHVGRKGYDSLIPS